MLVHRLRRWPNIKTTLDVRLALAGGQGASLTNCFSGRVDHADDAMSGQSFRALPLSCH